MGATPYLKVHAKTLPRSQLREPHARSEASKRGRLVRHSQKVRNRFALDRDDAAEVKPDTNAGVFAHGQGGASVLKPWNANGACSHYH